MDFCRLFLLVAFVVRRVAQYRIYLLFLRICRLVIFDLINDFMLVGGE